MKRTAELIGGCALLLLSQASSAAGAAPPPLILGPTVQLPAYVVTDSRILPKQESWRYGTASGFEILSGASESQTRAMMDDFLLFHRAMEVVWPLTRMNAAVPASIILCKHQRQFAPFAPASLQGNISGTLSLSFQDKEMAAIVVELDTPALAGEEGAGESGMDSYTSGVLHREYVHFVLDRIGERVPPWLTEGLWKLFTSLRYSKDSMGLPAAPPEVPVAARKGGAAELEKALQSGAYLRLERLFAHAEGSTENADDSPWGRECYEFVHWGLFGAQSKNRGAFLVFALRAAREPVNEKLFSSCFGQSYAEALTALWAYTDFAVDNSYDFKGPQGGKAEPPPHPALRAASDSEVGRIKGEALRMAGRMEAAHLNLIAPYQRGSRDPELLASLGLEEAAAGKRDRARKFLEAAAAGHSRRARAYVELGRIRYEDALPATGGPDKRLSVEQLAAILEPLFTARRLPPPLPEVYRTIADAWEHAGIKPQRGHLAVLDEGVALFPYDADLVYRDAALRKKYGFNEDAAALCSLGLQYAESEQAGGRFRALLSSLPLKSAGQPAQSAGSSGP